MNQENILRLAFVVVLIFIDLIVAPLLLFANETVYDEEMYQSPSLLSKEEATLVESIMLRYFRERYPSDIITSHSPDYPLGFILVNGTLMGYYIVWIYKTYTHTVFYIAAFPLIAILNVAILVIIYDPKAVFSSKESVGTQID